MTYDLYIGDRTFSSWSLRGWLMLKKFGLPHRTHMVGLYAGTMADDLADLKPARLVPVLRAPDGTVIGETLAMAEALASRHPDLPFWPLDARLRDTARWLCAEMTSGFGALRSACPMQLMHVYKGFDITPDVRADLDRIETLWAHARTLSGTAAGPLFGAYSLADVFYTPIAARIIGYDLSVSDASRAYCMHLLSDPTVRKWQAHGAEVTYDPVPYALDLATAPWPVTT